MPKFMACYIGTSEPGREYPSEEVIQRGMAAWQKWMEDHAPVIVESGGPLGKTKRIDDAGVADTSNALTGFVIIEAPDHDTAAAMFENHPHFSIFPGDAVDVMQIMPIPNR